MTTGILGEGARPWLLMAVAAACLGCAAAQAADVSTQTPRAPAGSPALATPAPDGELPSAAAGAPRAQSNAIEPGASQEAPPKPSQAPPPSAPSAPGSASLESGFTFQVCNRSSQGAKVVINHREGSGWLMEGWFGIGPGQCKNVGRFPHGWFYYYADGDNNGAWGSGVVQLCARYPGPFQRLDDGSRYTCRRDERLRPFSGRFLDGNIGTYTWNLDE